MRPIRPVGFVGFRADLMHLRLTHAPEGLHLDLDDEGRRFLRANIIEAMEELGEDEYETRTGFSLGQARQFADLLRRAQ